MTAGRRDQLASALDVALLGIGENLPAEVTHSLAAYLDEHVVDRMIRQAQAEALESAADDWIRDEDGMFDSDSLRDRAAALRADLPSGDGVI